MGSLILIVTVIAATTLKINNVCSKPLTENDIEHVLQTLQDRLQQEHSKKHKHDQDERQDEDSDDDTDHYGSLKNYQAKDVGHLTKRNRYRQAEQEEHRSNHRDLKNDQLSQQILEQLLHSKQERSQQQHKQKQYKVKSNLKKQHHLPNDLLASLGLSDDRQNQLDLVNNDDDKKVDLDLSDYSKVYVVLNSEAVRKSKNKKKLNSFLSNLLSASSDNQRAAKKERRYKGFVVKDFEARRSNRDSKEKCVIMANLLNTNINNRPNVSGSFRIPEKTMRHFPKAIKKETVAPNGPIDGVDERWMSELAVSDNDYKPKRYRGERGGGGEGGGGGRTAIPYIRHRGDIYEKGD